MTDHCVACEIARILLHHRDQVAPTWDQRRVTLNFARIVAERACPAYQNAQRLTAKLAETCDNEDGPDRAVCATQPGPDHLIGTSERG